MAIGVTLGAHDDVSIGIPVFDMKTE